MIALTLASSCRVAVHVSQPRMIYVASGDSVLIVDSGPIYESETSVGYMFEYHPFAPLADTDQLRQLALDLWSQVRPKAESLKAPFVALRATTRLTERPTRQFDQSLAYTFVLEKRPDGRWYFLNDSVPIRDDARARAR